jgi:Na+-driven multidrug efflux pump
LVHWDPAVIAAFHSVVPQLVLVQVIGGAVFAWDGIVMGVTDFRYAMLATVVPAVVALAALAPVLPLGWPLAAVWWAVVVLMVGRAAMLAGWHRYRLAGF